MIGFFVFFGLIYFASQLSIAQNNPREALAVEISQLVQGDIAAGRYVRISGLAFYPAAYEETEDDRVVSEYYYVMDEISGHMVLVKAAGAVPSDEQEVPVTISGLTQTTDSKLQDLVESDLSDIQAAGLKTIATLYVGENESPADPTSTSVIVGVLALALLACVATLFFPSTIFVPKPVDALDSGQSKGIEIMASGQLKKLDSVDPLKFSNHLRRFNNTIANVYTMGNREMLVYIIERVSHRVYGATVRRTETHWGLLLDASQALEVEPGMVFVGHDRWGLRVQYHDERERMQTLLVSFNSARAQAEFVNNLRQIGFVMSGGLSFSTY